MTECDPALHVDRTWAVDPADLGWRERKKLATRDAICAAAWRLAMAHGPDKVRVEDIANEAGVSPRTFNNYFSSREEAIFAHRLGIALRVAATIADRPADEPLDRAVIGSILEVHGEFWRNKEMLRMAVATPAMRAEWFRRAHAGEVAMADAIARRLSIDMTTDLGPRLVAAAFTAAIRVATEYWLRDDSDLPFTDVLGDALARVSPVAQILPADAPAAARPGHPSPNPSPQESAAC